MIDSIRLDFTDADEVAFTPDASRLTATFGDGAAVYTIADRVRIAIPSGGDRYDRPAFNATGTMVVATTTSAQFSHTNLGAPNSTLVLRHQWGPGDTIRDRSNHYTVQSLLSADGTLVLGLYRDAVVVWRSADGAVVERQPLAYTPGGPEPRTMAASGDASHVVIGYGRANSMAWDRARHTLRPLLPPGGDVVQRRGRRIDATAVGFLPNSHALFVAAAAGEEFTYEDATWKNGAFTYALLDGLTTKDADANRDGIIMVSELRAHVTRVVRELTGGRQTPTSRRENLANDFPVLP